MTPRLAQREVALAGVALFAAVLSLALVEGRASRTESLPPVAGGWHTAVAGVWPVADTGKRTACGVVIGADTFGVSHPVLPCGAKLYLARDGRTVLTQVIDRGPTVPGRDFDLTGPLAAKLDVSGVAEVRWAYAAPPS